MSRRNSKVEPVHSDDIATTPAYEVGYRKPPKQNQFQKGQSGNRKGRPKKRKRIDSLAQFYGVNEFDRMLLEEASRPIPTREGEISTIQAVIRSMAVAAMKGDRAARECFTGLIKDAQRDQAKAKEKVFDSWVKHVDAWAPIFKEHEEKGLPAPDVFPNPFDIFINIHTREARLEGPSTAAAHQMLMGQRMEVIRHMLDANAAAKDFNAARSKEKKRRCLERWHQAQALFDELNDKLPLRYQAELEHRSFEDGASMPTPNWELAEFIMRMTRA